MSIIAVERRSQQAANMAAARDPMVDLLAQMAALEAENEALQGQVANLQPGFTAPTSAIYARTPATPTTSFSRTPALREKTDLLDFEKKTDRNVYEDSMSPILSGDDRVDAATKQLM